MDRRTRLTSGLIAALVCGSCGAAPIIDVEAAAPSTPAAVTVILAGDAMLGRNVAPIVAADPDGLFADVRHEIRRADIAAVNVESPLTDRPHTSPNPYALEADPQSANLLAAAGFDIAGIANNHAG
ncbi:MAG: CapA family protein, partial [Acidimicrobiia bacterium]